MQQCINVGGYSEMTIELFYDSLVELLEKLVSGTSVSELYQELNEENATSDYCTWYLRALLEVLCKQLFVLFAQLLSCIQLLYRFFLSQ